MQSSFYYSRSCFVLKIENLSERNERLLCTCAQHGCQSYLDVIIYRYTDKPTDTHRDKPTPTNTHTDRDRHQGSQGVSYFYKKLDYSARSKNVLSFSEWNIRGNSASNWCILVVGVHRGFLNVLNPPLRKVNGAKKAQPQSGKVLVFSIKIRNLMLEWVKFS